MSDFKDILNEGAGSSSKLSDEQLMAYLEGRLSGEELRQVEAVLANEGMEGDAVEGLQQLGTKDAQQLTQQLNAKLQKALGKKRRKRRGMASQQGAMVALVILILLIVMCFAVFWLMKHKGA